MQQLVLMGTFFVLPVYLQVVLGLDAFETGKRLFPMSIAMLIAALGGTKLAARFAPKRVCQLGLAALTIATILLVGTIDVELNERGFALALAIFGLGGGFLMSQLGNVIMSSVEPSKSNETGGLQGTAQNLGASLGTALIGSILILGLTNGFTSRIEQNEAIPASVREEILIAAESGIDIVPVQQVEEVALDAGMPQADAEEVASDYGDAQLEALKRSLGAVAVFALLAFWFTRRLPARPAESPAPEPLPEEPEPSV
jgi:MFS family permease